MHSQCPRVNEIESSVLVFTGVDSSGSAEQQGAEQQLPAITSGALCKHDRFKVLSGPFSQVTRHKTFTKRRLHRPKNDV